MSMPYTPSPAATDNSAAPKVSILLVDDYPPNLLALESVLADLGHNLVQAHCGEDALQQLLDGDFAVVLLDVRMSGLDGFETAKRIRAQARTRHTPIIFLTAHDDNQLCVEEAYSLGAVDYLVKPVVPIILRAKVVAFVDLFLKTAQVQWQTEQLRAMERREFERQLAYENDRLRDSEARNAAILATTLEGIITIDHHGAVVEFNPAAEQMFGFHRADVLGRDLADLIVPPDLRDGHRRGMARYLSTGAARLLGRRTEMTALRADGTEFPIELTIIRIPTAGPPVFTGHARDITERKRGERRRNARLAVTQTLAEAATTAEAAPQILRAIGEGLGWDVGTFWTADRDAGCLRCTAQWHRAGAPVEVFEATTRQITLRRGQGLPGQVWNEKEALWIADVTAEGNFLRVDVAVNAELHGAFGFPVRLGADVLGVVEFLSREIRAPDADLLEMMTTIGGQIGQFLDRKQAEDRLRQRAEQLAESDRRKDEFLAMLAHELRNPLAPIRNALYVLGLPSTSRDIAAQAHVLMERQVQNMVRLVDDLLDVSRITRGKVQLRKELVTLAVVLQSAVESTRPLVEANRHTLTLVLAPDPVCVLADPTRLEQVFANLLNNAAKYTERGGAIEIVEERHTDTVSVYIRDTGFGIPAAMLPHVFDLFTQVDRTLDRAQGGLGIGLTLVKTLVETHGGTVSAHSEGVGKGSEFIVRLPIERTPVEPSGACGDPVPHLGGTAASLKVLVVEDNLDAAESFAMLLSGWGHDVRIAHDGASGLKAARSYRPSIAFLDIGLPGIDGYELARRMRSEVGSGIRLVAMTGYGQESDRQRAVDAGFDCHLTKPADLDTLQRLLAEPRAAE